MWIIDQLVIYSSLQMDFIAVHIGHEGFPICEPYIRNIIILLEVIHLEISIRHKALHIQVTGNHRLVNLITQNVISESLMDWFLAWLPSLVLN